MLPLSDNKFAYKRFFDGTTYLAPNTSSLLGKLKFYGKLLFRLTVALIIIISPLIIKYPYLPKAYVYDCFRELGKISMEVQTRNMLQIEGEHFVVSYQPADSNIAALVLDTAEEFYKPVTKDFKFNMEKKIPIVIYPTREELGKSFGWAANESAMGVYYSGVIRILSPKEWIDSPNQLMFNRTFRNSGPMAHEFTHLVVDYLTRGNYPRWFTEGLAQYEEYKITGFKFTEKEGSLRQPLYQFKDMDSTYDNLPNQSLAYRQSLIAIHYIVEKYGEEKLEKILSYLAKGTTLNKALQLSLGVSLKEFETNYQKWIKDNINILENNLK